MNQADISNHLRRTTCCRQSPCNRQGLPLFHVTTVDCELLPHSFHLFPNKSG